MESHGTGKFGQTHRPPGAAYQGAPHPRRDLRGGRTPADALPHLVRGGVWEPLLPYLTGFRTIAFDPPGIGRSPMPARPMSMRALASLGAAILDELGIESAHVLGASFGGAVAQHMAICHPGRVRRLVLASTSFGAFAIPGHPAALWHIVHPGSHRDRTEEIAGDTFGGRLRTEPGLVRTMPMRSPRNIPTALYNMAPLIPHAQLHTVEGGGHVMLVDSPARVAPIITKFLRGGQPGETEGALPA